LREVFGFVEDRADAVIAQAGIPRDPREGQASDQVVSKDLDFLIAEPVPARQARQVRAVGEPAEDLSDPPTNGGSVHPGQSAELLETASGLEVQGQQGSVHAGEPIRVSPEEVRVVPSRHSAMPIPFGRRGVEASHTPIS